MLLGGRYFSILRQCVCVCVCVCANILMVYGNHIKVCSDNSLACLTTHSLGNCCGHKVVNISGKPQGVLADPDVKRESAGTLSIASRPIG